MNHERDQEILTLKDCQNNISMERQRKLKGVVKYPLKMQEVVNVRLVL